MGRHERPDDLTDTDSAIRDPPGRRLCGLPVRIEHRPGRSAPGMAGLRDIDERASRPLLLFGEAEPSAWRADQSLCVCCGGVKPLDRTVLICDGSSVLCSAAGRTR